MKSLASISYTLERISYREMYMSVLGIMTIHCYCDMYEKIGAFDGEFLSIKDSLKLELMHPRQAL